MEGKEMGREGGERGVQGTRISTVRADRETSGSKGNILELLGAGKRRGREVERNEEEGKEGVEAFKKSKVVARTPEREGMGRDKKKEMGMEEWLKVIREGIWEDMEKEMRKIGRKVDEGLEEMRRQIKEMKECWEEARKEQKIRMDQLEMKVEEMVLEKGGNEGLERSLREIEIKADKKEREIRKKNIVIKGIRRGDLWEVEKEVKEIWDSIGETGEGRESRGSEG